MICFFCALTRGAMRMCNEAMRIRENNEINGGNSENVKL